MARQSIPEEKEITHGSATFRRKNRHQPKQDTTMSDNKPFKQREKERKEQFASREKARDNAFKQREKERKDQFKSRNK